MPSITRQVLAKHFAWACAKLGPSQTRDLVVDNYLVVDNKKAKQTLKNNHFRQQNSFPFQLKRKTTLIVDNKRGYFVVDNSFSLVCETATTTPFSQCLLPEGSFRALALTCAVNASYQALA